jgi:2OG-Fe(II) oxygenase superfamily
MRITNTGVISDPEEVARLREEFRAVNCVRIPQLLDSSLLAFLWRRLEQCQWTPNSHGELGLEYTTEDLPALHLCHFITNLPEFRAVVEEITECHPLDVFRGRLYRKMSGSGHFNKWHNDYIDNRSLTLSINLSTHEYRGGVLQLRRSGSEEMLAQMANTGFGDALIFRISRELEHRVSDVEGDEPKTAFAGWYRHDRPGFFELIKDAQKEIEPEVRA